MSLPLKMLALKADHWDAVGQQLRVGTQYVLAARLSGEEVAEALSTADSKLIVCTSCAKFMLPGN